MILNGPARLGGKRRQNDWLAACLRNEQHDGECGRSLVAADSIPFWRRPTRPPVLEPMASVKPTEASLDRPLRRYPTGRRRFRRRDLWGGIAGIEGLLRLRRLAGDQLDMILLSPADYLVYRPLAVLEPFAAARRAAIRSSR